MPTIHPQQKQIHKTIVKILPINTITADRFDHPAMFRVSM